MNRYNPLARAQRLLGRFRRDRDGAAAVEFALVAFPFISLLFAILELGLVFLVSTTLQNAADAAARKIRTGELQAGNGNKQGFKTAICNEMSWLGADCLTNLTVDVRTFTNFDSMSSSDPITDGVIDEAKTQFAPGNAEDIVLVRVYYTYTLITPLLSTGLQTMADGKRLISTTVTFRNEPWAN